MHGKSKARFFILITLTVGAGSSHAELLAPGRLRLHQGFTVSTASSLWQGPQARDIGLGVTAPASAAATGPSTQATTATGSNTGSLVQIQSVTTASLGILAGFQLDATFVFTHLGLTNGSEGGRIAGDYERALSDIGLKLRKGVYQVRATDGFGFQWSLFGGARAPGNAPNTGDDFLALNDGAVKFDVGTVVAFEYRKVGLTTELGYTVRSNRDLASQLSLRTTFPIRAVKGLTFGPRLDYFNTLGGTDLGDADFNAATAARGGLPAYSTLKQEFTSVGLFGVVPVGKNVTLDGAVDRRISGRNTPVGTGVSVGVGVGF